MSRLSKAIFLGTLISVFGLLMSVLPPGLTLEENIGLELLFRMRGVRQAPSEVIVVGINEESAVKLNLPHDLDKWPHSLHARLVDLLVKGGARVIAFDIFFNESRSHEDDILLADALLKAQNVVLIETIKKNTIVLKNEKGSPGGEVHIEKRMLPISPLLQSSLAVAPFPLPKVPVKVRQYWTFKTAAGDIPTLPLTVFQVYALEVYEEFIRLVKKYYPAQTANLPHSGREFIDNKNMDSGMRMLRDIFESDRTIAGQMLEELNNADRASDYPGGKHLIRSLINMYQSPVSRYLNFYGPAHTITTVPYYRALQSQGDAFPHQKKIDFSGKAVFIGSSEIVQPQQRDGYYTVFSKSSGVDISGVEIAATAFANLLENMPVQPLDFNARSIIIVLWGLAIGMVWRFFPPIITTVGVLMLSILYTVTILHKFNTSGIWYPLFVPLLFQAPLAFFGAMAWKYYDTNKDRQNIRKAFSFYLPDNVINKISDNVANLKVGSEVVYATCLCTDAEQYSALCETMDPDNLGSFMNKYYETVFGPVKYHDGVVSNVVADSMLALWVTLNPDAVPGKKASLAALDIAKAVEQFNQSFSKANLPTRIGLHSGFIFLGNIGAIDHYEYRPVGDIVNTATRIEGLNKQLGTNILVSDDVLQQIDGFLTREMGEFLFVGKSKPLVVHELICLMEKSTRQQRELCSFFSDALAFFKQKLWEEASNKFHELLRIFGDDGPSTYYIRLCNHFRENPYEEAWGGVVHVDKK